MKLRDSRAFVKRPRLPVRQETERQPKTATLARDLPPADEALAEYPAGNGYDLDFPHVGHPGSVPGADPHWLDRDDYGMGCEVQD